VNNEPDHIDLEALGLDHLRGHARTATFAPNWKSVLAADAAVGMVLAACGVVGLRWSAFSWLLVAAGLVYIALVVRRGLQWRWFRQQAGLDT